jgi:hypothetical protein
MAMPIRRGVPVAFLIRWGHFAVSQKIEAIRTTGARPARRRTRELSGPESVWMRAWKRAMCVSARRKEPGRNEK